MTFCPTPCQFIFSSWTALNTVDHNAVGDFELVLQCILDNSKKHESTSNLAGLLTKKNELILSLLKDAYME